MDNLGFIVAGYGLTWVVLAWYTWRTNRRLDGAARAVAEWEDDGADAPGGPTAAGASA
ncbi:MAG: hypothetical protein RRA92_01545 [Gemmatimonadota bacterium]|nr:hypothetical protein [Gemmatimonadota bacterium]